MAVDGGGDEGGGPVFVLEKNSAIIIYLISEKDIILDTVLTDEVRVLFNVRITFHTLQSWRKHYLSFFNLQMRTRKWDRRQLKHAMVDRIGSLVGLYALFDC